MQHNHATRPLALPCIELSEENRLAVCRCCRYILEALSDSLRANSAAFCPDELLEQALTLAQRRWKESAELFLYAAALHHEEMLLLAELLIEGRLRRGTAH